MKMILVVTHGEKVNGANPGMTPLGFEQVATLSGLLPEKPSMVICGTGQRHLDVAKALGLTPTRYSSIAGNADSLEVIDGKKMAVLANGIAVPLETYPAVEESAPSAKVLLSEWPNGTVVCSGRPFMLALGYSDAKSGMAYRIDVDGQSFAISMLAGQGVVDPYLTK